MCGGMAAELMKSESPQSGRYFSVNPEAGCYLSVCEVFFGIRCVVGRPRNL